MLNIVLLPATEPGDQTYGTIPENLKIYPSAHLLQVRYPTMVWYNETVRMEAVAQIRSFGVSSIILVGFSKSGLGAWNIVRMIPGTVSGTIIFDAPVAREKMPQWGTSPFYRDNLSWQKDVPIHTVDDFQSVVPKRHKLVLISGENFHDEMSMFVNKLYDTTISYVFLPRPYMKHHWQSGWIEEGLRILLSE
jgi:hypothetical protein